MGRIVFSIISLIVLAIIIVMNAGTVGAFNVFGYEFEEVPVIVIAIVSFVLGAIYSFVFYFSSYLARARREKLAMQKQRLKSQEETIKSKDASLKAREKESAAAPSAQRALPAGRTPGAAASARPAERSGGWLRNVFGKKNKKPKR